MSKIFNGCITKKTVGMNEGSERLKYNEEIYRNLHERKMSIYSNQKTVEKNKFYNTTVRYDGTHQLYRIPR